jgi:hypothetical protein
VARRKKSQPQLRNPPRRRPAAFSRSTSQPLGQPDQSGRPLVTSRVGYMIEPIFKNAPRADVGIEAPSGAPGMYHVIYVLAVPGRDVVQDEVNFPKLQASGDSLLAVDPEVHELRVQLQEPSTRETQVATVGVNSAHRLRDIELEIRATSFDAAEQIAHDIVSPLLSRWAFLHDVAITTSGMQIIEAATMIQRLQVAIVGAVKGFSDTTGSSDPEHRLLLSAYRDGISATEPLWQALSLYRLAEGVLELRKRRSAEAVASGLVPNEPSERVPDDLTTIGHPVERSALLELSVAMEKSPLMARSESPFVAS